MKNLLISYKLHKALTGKTMKHKDMSNEDWEELDLEARASIILCLERDVAFLVGNEESVVAVWKKFMENFMTKTQSNKI